MLYLTSEHIWLIAMSILSTLVVFKNNSILLIFGCALITYSYAMLLGESRIPHPDFEVTRWITRIGISFIVFDAIIRSKFLSPVERIANFLVRIKKCVRKAKRLNRRRTLK